MAPATNLGAASPVAIGAPGGAPDKSGKKKDDDKDAAPAPTDTLMRKQTHDAAAYIRGLAQLRGRNVEWAERAVREAVSLSAEEALKLKVIEVVAEDVPALLRQLEARKVSAAGTERTLATGGAETVAFQPDWRTRILSIITDPSIG
jgi:membrane-bound serine protease (ClpP class)